MTTTRSTTPTRPPRAGRPHGQWKVDGTEPLNANEAWKQQDGGLNVRERIEQVYAVEGFASIPPEDLSGRFRWWGLYTQRRPGIDGGRTAQLDDTELSDEFFMLRIRLDGGALDLRQLRTLADDQPGVRARHGRHQRPAEHPAPLGPGRGRPRDLAAPRGGRAPDDRGLRRHPARHPRQPARRGGPRRARSTRLPSSRRSSRASSATPSSPTCRASSRAPSPGTRASTSSTRSTTSRSSGSCTPSSASATTSGSAGASPRRPGSPSGSASSCCPEEAAEVWHGVIRVFRDYGYRRLRNKARLKFLLAEWGPEKFRRVLEEEYLGRALPDGPAPAPARGPGDHVGVHEQKDGRHYVGAAPDRRQDQRRRPRRSRVDHGVGRLRPAAPDPPPEARPARRALRTGWTTSSATSSDSV